MRPLATYTGMPEATPTRKRGRPKTVRPPLREEQLLAVDEVIAGWKASLPHPPPQKESNMKARRRWCVAAWEGCKNGIRHAERVIASRVPDDDGVLRRVCSSRAAEHLLDGARKSRDTFGAELLTHRYGDLRPVVDAFYRGGDIRDTARVRRYGPTYRAPLQSSVRFGDYQKEHLARAVYEIELLLRPMVGPKREEPFATDPALLFAADALWAALPHEVPWEDDSDRPPPDEDPDRCSPVVWRLRAELFEAIGDPKIESVLRSGVEGQWTGPRAAAVAVVAKVSRASVRTIRRAMAAYVATIGGNPPVAGRTEPAAPTDDGSPTDDSLTARADRLP